MTNAKKVLIVDDSANNARAMAEILKREGYDVDCARNSDDALDALITNPPDVVLIDYNLNGSDLKGDKICAEVRLLYRNLIGVIGMSGDETAEHKMRSAGVNHFLSKPVVTRMTLLDVVAKYSK